MFFDATPNVERFSVSLIWLAGFNFSKITSPIVFSSEYLWMFRLCVVLFSCSFMFFMFFFMSFLCLFYVLFWQWKEEGQEEKKRSSDNGENRHSLKTVRNWIEKVITGERKNNASKNDRAGRNDRADGTERKNTDTAQRIDSRDNQSNQRNHDKSRQSSVITFIKVEELPHITL